MMDYIKNGMKMGKKSLNVLIKTEYLKENIENGLKMEN